MSPSDQRDPPDPVEPLLAQAVQVLEQRGEPGLQEFLTAHLTEAPAIRDGLERLRRLGILAPPSELPAQRIQFGEFRVVRRLGAGGMGVVYAAQQESLQRMVALKVVRPEFLLSATARERFQREVEAIARLNHPGIVPILAVGNDPSHPWFAMEYIEGQSLEQMLRQLQGQDPARLTGHSLRQALGADLRPGDTGTAFAGSHWETCVRLVLQVAVAMSYVHDRGIVHRDLKPSNIIVTKHGQAMVVDFGLARVRDLQRVTRDATPIGSPAYAPPELLRGEPTDERVDVYGLGVTLYELLTTHLPYEYESMEALQAAILVGNPPAVRTRNRAVPRDLEIVCMVAIDRDPARRYRSMQDLVADLESVLARRAIAARPLGVCLRLLRLAQRNATWSIALAALVVVALQFPLVLWRQQASANQALAAANAQLASTNVELAAQRANADAGFADALRAVERMLLVATENHLVRIPGSEAIQYDMLRDALGMFATLRRRHPGQSELERLAAHTMGRFATLVDERGDAERARALRDEALNRLAEIPGGEAAAMRGSLGRMAAAARGAAGDRPGQLAYMQGALCDAERALAASPDDAERRATAATTRAQFAVTQPGSADDPVRVGQLQRAVDEIEALAAEHPDDPVIAWQVADVHLRFAVLCRTAAPEQARAHVDRGLAVLSPWPPTGRDEAYMRQRLADLFELDACLHDDAKRSAKAIEGHGQALALRHWLWHDFPTNHEHKVRLARSLCNLALVYQRLQQMEAAFGCWHDCVPLYRSAVDQAPHASEHARGLEVAVATYCVALLRHGRLETLATMVPIYAAAARSAAAKLEAARLALGLGQALGERGDGRAGEDWLLQGLGWIEAVIAEGFVDRDHFERGHHHRGYDPIRGWPRFVAALQRIDPR